MPLTTQPAECADCGESKELTYGYGDGVCRECNDKRMEACPSGICYEGGEECGNCDGAGEDGYGDCHRCGGSGWVIPSHCCACGGSPYCVCCRVCGAACVGDCTCPIAGEVVQ